MQRLGKVVKHLIHCVTEFANVFIFINFVKDGPEDAVQRRVITTHLL